MKLTVSDVTYTTAFLIVNSAGREPKIPFRWPRYMNVVFFCNDCLIILLPGRRVPGVNFAIRRELGENLDHLAKWCGNNYCEVWVRFQWPAGDTIAAAVLTALLSFERIYIKNFSHNALRINTVYRWCKLSFGKYSVQLQYSTSLIIIFERPVTQKT
jgi:hypothetical protein